MNKRARVRMVVLTGALMVALPALAQTSPSQKTTTQQDRHHLAEQAFYGQRAYGGKTIPKDAYKRAFEQWQRLPRAVGPSKSGVARPGAAATSLNGTVWKPFGPSPIGQGGSTGNGRVNAIAVNPNNPNMVYAGTAGGGVWRTTNALAAAGPIWTALTDQQPSLGTGEPSDVAIDPNNTNTIYVGTSARNAALNITAGILKSTDAGGSWVILGSGFPAGNVGNAQALFGGTNISAIVVDPANSNNLYIAADNGLFWSIDGGRNWTQGNNGAVLSQSLVLDASSPTNARVLFAGATNSGVLRSNDGGRNWTLQLNPAGAGKVVVALAPPASPPNAAGVQVVYAALDTVGVYETTNQGANWTQRPATGFTFGTQGGFDLEIGVDPASPGNGTGDTLYIGQVGLFKSTDSAGTFTSGSGPGGLHADFHAKFAFVQKPAVPSVIYVGNDGGIWRSDDGGAHWTGSGQGGAPVSINGGGMQTALIYNMDLSKDATASVTLTGLQDNGIVRLTGALAGTDTIGGDGFGVAFDTITPTRAYMTSGFWGGCSPPLAQPFSCTLAFQSTTSGSSWVGSPSYGNASCGGEYSVGNVPNAELDCVTAVPGVHPMRVDPTDSNYVYLGGAQNLFQTTNGTGGSFRNISNNNFGRPNSVDIAAANPNNVAVGVGSQVWVSTNAKAATVGAPNGVTFTNITRNLPGGAVTRVAFDPNDPTTIYATLSGFNGGLARHVYVTTINGTTWTNISPPVDIPTNAIALDGGAFPSTIYVGTDLGVLRSEDLGASWAKLDDAHLPNVPVTDLGISPQAGVLRAATFGRGVFDFAAPTGPVIAVNAQNGLQFGSACVGSTTSLTLQVFNVGTQNLLVSSVKNLFNSPGFTVLPNPATPLIIGPNAEVDFTIQFTPSAAQSYQATIRISSNDPGVPNFDLTATGVGSGGSIGTSIADTGNFGGVCIGSFVDLPMTVNNSGSCPLMVNNILPSDAEFLTPNTSFPFSVAPGASVQFAERFQPVLPTGTRNATLDVTSNDPFKPNVFVGVSGQSQAPLVSVTGMNNFGNVCAGVVQDETFKVCNLPVAGTCQLNVTNVSLNAGCKDFTIISNPFPEYLGAEVCGNVVVQFTPTSDGTKTCNLIVTSSDPATPIDVVPLTGTTPIPSISLSTALAFPPVVEGNGKCAVTQPFPVRNTGICPLTVTGVTLGPPNPEDYALNDLPNQTNVIPPGGALSQGGFGVRFQPVELNRNVDSAVDVTYISDPILGTKTTLARNLCGEGVFVGARVLVTLGGVPVSTVDRIQLIQVSTNTVIDNVVNATLKTITPKIAKCAPFQFQREYGTVSDPKALAPGTYQVKVTLTIAGKQQVKTVTFTDNSCGFAHPVVVAF
jgi:hypothetical protein